MRHTDKTNEVFQHSYEYKDGYLYPSDKPGLGIEFDEELSKKYPYERAYLPVNRQEDGTLFNW
jgi:mannonate dehydratase